MTDHHAAGGSQSPEDLMGALHHADPAKNLPALAAWQIHVMKETAMTTTANPEAKKKRRALTAIVGASAVAVALIAVGVVLSQPAGVTNLVTGPAIAAKCVTPDAETLKDSATVAFHGTVTSIADGKVTLSADQVFTGDVHDTVVVGQGDPDGPSDGAAPLFEDGESYYVAAKGDTLLSCGYTSLDFPAQKDLYSAAFGN